MNKKTIKALEDFKKAYNELNENWGNLNEVDSVQDYPFHGSFDELEVNSWVEDSIEQLQQLDKK